MNNWIQRAKQIWPGLNDQEADVILWSCTPYPSGQDTEVEAALRDIYLRSGGDLWIALNQADQELTAKQLQQ